MSSKQALKQEVVSPVGESAREAAERAREIKEQAHAEVDKALRPIKEKRAALVEKHRRLKSRESALQEKLSETKSLIRQVDVELRTLYEEVKEAGIPPALVGFERSGYSGRIYPRDKNPRTTITPEDVGSFDPVEIRGFKYQSGKLNPCVISIKSDGKVFKSKRIDKRGEIQEDLRSLPYKNASRRLYDVTALPGWLETRDVAYAIVTHLGLQEKFPDIGPSETTDHLSVDGKSIA